MIYIQELVYNWYYICISTSITIFQEFGLLVPRFWPVVMSDSCFNRWYPPPSRRYPHENVVGVPNIVGGIQVDLAVAPEGTCVSGTSPIARQHCLAGWLLRRLCYAGWLLRRW